MSILAPSPSHSVHAAADPLRNVHALQSDDMTSTDRAEDQPLRMVLRGVTPDETSVLEAILRVLRERTARRWVLSTDDAGDLLLTTRKAAGPSKNVPLTAVLLREDEGDAAPDTLSVQSPLRVMAVLDLLNAAHDRLRRLPPMGAAITREQPALEADDGKSLATVLARLVQRRQDQSFRVRIVGQGTLYLCMKSRVYHGDFPRERLVDALNEHRFVITLIPATSAELVVRLDSAWPVDEALWQIGLMAVNDGPQDMHAAYRLRRWPDFARLPHRPEYLKVCAALTRSPRTLADLVASSGLGEHDVRHLLHACRLCGYLDTAALREATAPAPTTVAPGGSGLGGLFDRLRRRFGL